MPDYDVLVVGAGPGGSSTATALARSGIRTLLLDKSEFPRDKTCGDGLSPRALAALNHLGLLDELLPHGRVIRSLEIVGPNGRGVDARVPSHPGLPDYSFVIPRMVLDDAVRRKAVESGAAFEGGTHVTGIERQNGRAVVTAGRGGKRVEYRAPLVVVATGANVALLVTAGILKEKPPLMLAARAYFEGLRDLPDRTAFRFDGVPLPGYGWLFPVSETCVNVGAGFFARKGRARRRLPSSPRVAFERFIQHSPIRAALAGARMAGPLKSYPLRVDFLTAPTHAEGVLLVGEAAGLVNPLTGEGIDYALESGPMAAEAAAVALASGDFSAAALSEYDRRLRERFGALFAFCQRVQEVCLHPFPLNWLIAVARRRADLKMLLINIALGNQQAVENVSPLRVARALMRG